MDMLYFCISPLTRSANLQAEDAGDTQGQPLKALAPRVAGVSCLLSIVSGSVVFVSGVPLISHVLGRSGHTDL